MWIRTVDAAIGGAKIVIFRAHYVWPVFVLQFSVHIRVQQFEIDGCYAAAVEQKAFVVELSDFVIVPNFKWVYIHFIVADYDCVWFTIFQEYPSPIG